jgi:uncharacterized membrane protein
LFLLDAQDRCLEGEKPMKINKNCATIVAIIVIASIAILEHFVLNPNQHQSLLCVTLALLLSQVIEGRKEE